MLLFLIPRSDSASRLSTLNALLQTQIILQNRGVYGGWVNARIEVVFLCRSSVHMRGMVTSTGRFIGWFGLV